MASQRDVAHRRVEQLKRSYGEAQRVITQSLATVGGAFRAIAERYDQEARRVVTDARSRSASSAPAFAGWDDPVWNDWHFAEDKPRELRVGNLLDLPQVPATLPLTGRPVIVQTRTQRASGHARELLRSLAARCALAGGDRVVLHLIDPAQEGFGFPERGLLPQSAPRTADVGRDLKTIIDAGYASEGKGGPERSTGMISHIVLAMDFPFGYSPTAVEHLNRIANLGPAGIQLVVHHRVDGESARGRGLEVTWPLAFSVDDDAVAFGAWGTLAATVDAAPPESLLRSLVARMPERDDDEMAGLPSFETIVGLDPGRWWMQTAEREARAIIGTTVGGAEAEISFGQDERGESRAHAVLAGTTGSGKSRLLQATIISLATRYPPQELRLHLIDGFRGDSMKIFEHLPHADLVSLNTPIDLAASLVIDVGAELNRRAAVGMGTPQLGRAPFPRLLVVVDEYQDLLRSSRSDEVIATLQRIGEQGRGLGVHLLLASQRIKAVGLPNPGALFANIATRICMKVTKGDLEAATEFDRAGRAMIADHCTRIGRMVVNNDGGRDGANVAGYVTNMGDEEGGYRPLATVIAQLTELAHRRGASSTPQVLQGKTSPQRSDNLTLRVLRDLAPCTPQALQRWARAPEREGGLASDAWQPYDHPQAFIVGRSFTAFGSAWAKVDRDIQQNVLVVADDPRALTGIVAAGLRAAALCTAAGRARALVLSELPPPGAWDGALSRDLAADLRSLGHDVTAARSTQAVADLLAEADAEVNRRLDLDARILAEQPAWWLAGIGLDRLGPFRLTEGRYGPETSETTAQLLRILKDGPAVGVHTVLGFTSRGLWERVFQRQHRSLFAHRFLQQMAEDDSFALVDSGFAHKIDLPDEQGPVRAGYVDVQKGRAQPFLPYLVDEQEGTRL